MQFSGLCYRGIASRLAKGRIFLAMHGTMIIEMGNKLINQKVRLCAVLRGVICLLLISCESQAPQSPPPPPPGSSLSASFKSQPSIAAPGQQVQFTDTSTGNPTSWQWNFGDGGSATTQNPVHTYAQQGSYDVTLTVSNSSSSSSATNIIIVEQGSTYWVSPTGTAAWASAESTTPLSGTACTTVALAASNAQAGDIVYFRGGNYTGGLAPTGSGTSATNRITFAAYNGESPIFTTPKLGAQYCGLSLSGNSYVLVTGLTFVDFWEFALLTNGCNHCEVANCDFHGTTGEGIIQGFYMIEEGNNWTAYVSHLWIHNNNFYNAHYAPADQSCVEGADLLRVGEPSGTGSTAGLCNHITVENNHLHHGGHVCFDKYSQYDVIKNNIFHNEPWVQDFSNGTCSYVPTYDAGYTQYNGYFGHRCHQVTRGFADENGWTLVEGNRYCFGSVNPNNDGADCLDLAAASLIVRFNDVFQAMNNGMMAKYDWSQNSAVYNNTIYANGYGYQWKYLSNSCPSSVCPDDVAGFSFYDGQATGTGYWIVNNIFYKNQAYYSYGSDIVNRAGGMGRAFNATNYNAIAGQYVGNNWLTSMGDPKFVNETVDLTNIPNATSPNLSLQPGSTCIGAGVALAKATGAGSNSTTLVVNTAMPFQDGTWGADMTHGVTLFPDVIAIGTVSNTVAIQSINYAANTITLASPMTWTNGAPIWLYKNSSGQRVLYGTAPDLGAHPVVR